MRIVDRRRHECRRFRAGETKHEALVASTQIKFIVASFVDTLLDVLRLLVIADKNRATFMVDAIFGVVVANALQNTASKINVINVGVGGDFTCENDQSGRAESFSGNSAERVLFDTGIKNCIGDLIGHLVRMTFADRFRSKKIFAGHFANAPSKE